MDIKGQRLTRQELKERGNMQMRAGQANARKLPPYDPKAYGKIRALSSPAPFVWSKSFFYFFLEKKFCENNWNESIEKTYRNMVHVPSGYVNM